jgi:hypothetical protein
MRAPQKVTGAKTMRVGGLGIFTSVNTSDPKRLALYERQPVQ